MVVDNRKVGLPAETAAAAGAGCPMPGNLVTALNFSGVFQPAIFHPLVEVMKSGKCGSPAGAVLVSTTDNDDPASIIEALLVVYTTSLFLPYLDLSFVVVSASGT